MFPVDQKSYYPSGLEMINPAKVYFGIGSNSTNPYLYNGKELDRVGGLNMYDYGARWYNNISWSTMDPLAEKYYSTSPYAYCLNNPVKYVDPTGMIVEDPDGIYNKQKQQISSNLDAVNQVLKMEGLSEKMYNALSDLAGEYKTMMNEFSALDKSDQTYKVFGTDGNEGGVYYNKGTVMVGIGDKSVGLVGHELKHAYQFEIGEISFKNGQEGFGSLYDISDETAAYNRERLLNVGVKYFQTPNEIIGGYSLKMNDNDVRNFGKKMSPPAYQTLPSGPINTNSVEGQQLQKSSFLHGLTGNPLGNEICRGLFYSRGLNTR